MRALPVLLLCAVACGGSVGSETPDASTPPPGSDGGNAADAAPGGAIWHPPPDTTWQWQLTGTIDTSVDVAMYDIDLFDAPGATIDKLHGDGRVVICYFSAGSYENWRPDQGDFPAEALGKALDGWPGEYWLDVRRADVRAIMEKRLDRAMVQHCDGVEPDNVDGYANDNGFGLSAADQLDYNKFLAGAAHARGLSVGLKNDLDQIPDLVGSFDWSLDEECHQYDECAALAPFVAAGKAVFHAEYQDASMLPAICADTKPKHISTIVKKLELDAYRLPCP